MATHLEARRTAKYHIQVEITDRPIEIDTTTQVTVQGCVVRAFRGGKDLVKGDSVTFRIPVYVEREGPPTGPFYLPYREFVCATHLELYLNGEPPVCEVACEEFAIVDTISDQPQMTAGDFEQDRSQAESARRHSKQTKWWQFWGPR